MIGVVNFSPQLFDWLIKVKPPSPEVEQLAKSVTMTEEAQTQIVLLLVGQFLLLLQT